VAAVAAVVVIVSVLATGHKTTSGAAPRPPDTGCGAAATENTTLRFDFRVDVPAGFTTSPAAICSGMQQQYVDVKGDGIHVGSELNVVFPEGTVTVFRASAFDATAAQKARRMTVQGHRGYFGNLPGLGGLNGQGGVTFDPNTGKLVPPRSVPTLVWEYAPDSWAVVQVSWSKDPLVGAQLVADHVRIGEHQQLRIPFKLGWVPDGLVVGGAHDQMVGLSDATPAKTADCTTASCGSAMSVSVYLPGDPDAPHGPGTRQINIDGHKAIIYPQGAELDVGFGDRTLLIQTDPKHFGKFSDQDLINIAKHVTMSPNMTDQSTWFDATDVVPH